MGCVTSKCCTDNNIKAQIEDLAKISISIVDFLDSDKVEINDLTHVKQLSQKFLQ